MKKTLNFNEEFDEEIANKSAAIPLSIQAPVG